MEQACEIITCSQFSASWKHVDKSSYSGVNYSLGDSSEEASRGFLEVALILWVYHIVTYSLTLQHT